MSYSDTRAGPLRHVEKQSDAITSGARRDCGCRRTRLRPPHRDAKKIGRTTKQPGRTSFTIRPTRDSHTDAVLAMMSSLFRFPSVASKPRFSRDPVNLAPDCDG
jgi:hypothetical protein